MEASGKFKPAIWGGRRLETLLNKRLPPGVAIGESWEVVDLEEEQSVVAAGPARGKGLSELVQGWGVDLLGRAELPAGRYPLLIKFLDTRKSLRSEEHTSELQSQSNLVCPLLLLK